ncbi:MAG: cation:proton antiporter, partial [Myxococcota bacterium]
MPAITGVVFGVLVVGFILRTLKQPHVIVYLFAGMILGPSGVGLVTDGEVIDRVGALGMLLLLFFIGMEVSVAKLAELWRVAIIGTAAQISVSVGLTAVIGLFLDWTLARVVLLGFVLSLSSTAVVLKLLHDSGELESLSGQDALAILLAQDLALVPMMIVLNLLSGVPPSTHEIAGQVLGAILLVGIVIATARKKMKMPGTRRIQADPELRVFGGLAACFGLALISGALGLSSALGAFVAGMLVHALDESHWIEKQIEPFRVVLAAAFFVSVGMTVDIAFVLQNWWMTLILAAVAMTTNTAINAVALRAAGVRWSRSIYTGALLGQIGEFSFLLALAGRESHVIEDSAYRLIVAVIVVTLIASP